MTTGRAHIAKPTPASGGGQAFRRTSVYGDTCVIPVHGKQHMLADEASYFVARNPTPGTAIAGHAAPTTLDPLKPLITLFNPTAGSNTKRVYLDYIRLLLTNAGTGATTVRLTGQYDTIERRSSGGTQITPINHLSGDSGVSVVTSCWFGAITAVAASAAKVVADALHRNVIGVVGDTYTLNFGVSSPSPTCLLTSGTAIAHTNVNHPPVVIQPGHSFLLFQWAAGQSVGYQFELEMGWWER